MQRSHPVPEEEKGEFNILDPSEEMMENKMNPYQAQLDPQNFQKQPPNPLQQKQFRASDWLSQEECFDLFIDYIESDEWLLPIESFIDYFCLVFPTNNTQHHRPEKMKVYAEYKSIVNANLNNFLRDILAYDKD